MENEPGSCPAGRQRMPFDEATSRPSLASAMRPSWPTHMRDSISGRSRLRRRGAPEPSRTTERIHRRPSPEDQTTEVSGHGPTTSHPMACAGVRTPARTTIRGPRTMTASTIRTLPPARPRDGTFTARQRRPSLDRQTARSPRRAANASSEPRYATTIGVSGTMSSASGSRWASRSQVMPSGDSTTDAPRIPAKPPRQLTTSSRRQAPGSPVRVILQGVPTGGEGGPPSGSVSDGDAEVGAPAIVGDGVGSACSGHHPDTPPAAGASATGSGSAGAVVPTAGRPCMSPNATANSDSMMGRVAFIP